MRGPVLPICKVPLGVFQVLAGYVPTTYNGPLVFPTACANRLLQAFDLPVMRLRFF